MIEGLQDAHTRHGLLVHFPIVLTIVGMVFTVVFAFTKFRNATLRWVCVGCLAVGALGAFLAADAGEDAHRDIHDSLELSNAEHEAIEAHEELGDGGWKWPAIPALLIALTALRNRKAKVTLGALGVAAAIGAGGWVAVTGHRGGELVYRYGLGTPERGQYVPSESGSGGDQDADQDHDEGDSDAEHDHDAAGDDPSGP